VQKHKGDGAAVLVAGLLMAVLLLSLVQGAPTGASLTNISTSQKSAVSPQSGNHSKGSIHTIGLTAEQQDMKWKAYVGNISSTFVLDDANDYSIYQWTVNSFSGQVYLSRGAIDWSAVSCATIANKQAEDTAVGHTSTSEDSVNSTFVTQGHKGFSVGTIPINANQCFATATWANDTMQTASATTPFTELLLWDSTNTRMVYTTFVENNAAGYRTNPYDFQAIVPDDAVPANAAMTYYFYLELATT
jgi:hypothetical protein